MSVKKAAEQLAGLSGEDKRLALHMAGLIERATPATVAKVRRKRGPNKPKQVLGESLNDVRARLADAQPPTTPYPTSLRTEAPADTVRSVPQPPRTAPKRVAPTAAKGPLARKAGAKPVLLRKSGRVSPEALADALKGS